MTNCMACLMWFREELCKGKKEKIIKHTTAARTIRWFLSGTKEINYGNRTIRDMLNAPHNA